MRRVFHIVVTGRFAGVERYVCDTAVETAKRGWEVAVVGGDPTRMRDALGSQVRWEPGATPAESLRSVLRLGRWDLCHAHMTHGEAIAVATRRAHRARVLSTRHFAAKRGTSRAGRLSAPWIAARLDREIAVGEFAARNLERPPEATLVSGVRPLPCLWRASNRDVLVLQRLDREKDTLTALRAWQASQMAADGWALRVAGDGDERLMLERFAASEAVTNVTFAGWVMDIDAELARAGILLATTPAEGLGLGVLEAMAAGVPVVACGSGGHLETIGTVAGAPLFPPGDGIAAGAALRTLVPDRSRERLSNECRRAVAERFTIERHVSRLLAEYDAALAAEPHARPGGLPVRAQ